SFRIYVILNNDKFKKLEILLKNKFLLLLIFFFVALVSLLLSIGQILDPVVQQTKTIKIDSNEVEKYYICTSKDNITSAVYFILVIIDGIIIFTGIYISKEIKSVASEFYESVHITYALYCKCYFIILFL
ncbi:hypothetical protein BCR36DRAFT_280013, partial [Piromyces finnis]